MDIKSTLNSYDADVLALKQKVQELQDALQALGSKILSDLEANS